MSTLGSENLKELREKMGLTQVELARKLDVSNATVGMYETGKRMPSFKVCKKYQLLASTYGILVPLEYLRPE